MLSLGWFFGYDVFISYSRRDGKAYAVLLQEALRSRRYRCFLDDREMAAGEPLGKSIQAAIRHSSALIVIGTEGALQSQYVREELQIFAGFRKRKILPIDFGGVFKGANAASEPRIWLKDFIWIDEDVERLQQGPAIQTVEALIQSFHFAKRNTWRRLTITLIGIIVTTLLLVAAFFERSTVREQAQAELARKLREMDRLTTDASELLEFDPYQSALTLVNAMDVAQAAHEPVSAGAEAVARRWLDRPLECVLRGHTSNLLSTDWSSDGRWVATGGYDDLLRFWDATNNWLPAGAVDFKTTIGYIRFSPQADKIALANEDGTKIAVLSVAEKAALWVRDFEVGGKLMHLEWAPDGKSIYAVGRRIVWLSSMEGAEIGSWDCGEENQIRAFSSTPDGLGFAFASHGKKLYTHQIYGEGEDGIGGSVIKMPNWTTTAAWVRIPVSGKERTEAHRYEPMLILGDHDDRIYRWSANAGAAFFQRISGSPERLRIEDTDIVVGTQEGYIDGFSAEDGDPLFPSIRTGRRVTDLACAPEHRRIAVVSATERLTRIYEPERRMARRVYDDIELAPNQECVIGFSPDGTRFAAGERHSGGIYVGRPEANVPDKISDVFEYEPSQEDELSGRLEWSEKYLAGGYKSGLVRLWHGEVETEAAREIHVADEQIVCLSWRGNRDTLTASTLKGRVFFINCAPEAEPVVREIPELDGVLWGQWSQEGATFIGLDRKTQQLAAWTDTGGKRLISNVSGAAFSLVRGMQVVRIATRPGLHHVALAGLNGELAVVNYDDGKVIASRAGNGTPIFDFAWSPTGDVLAAARYDGTVLCGRGSDLQLVVECATNIPALSTIRWHPQGELLFAGGRSDNYSLVCIRFPALSQIREELVAYVRTCARRDNSITTNDVVSTVKQGLSR